MVEVTPEMKMGRRVERSLLGGNVSETALEGLVHEVGSIYPTPIKDFLEVFIQFGT